jgi:HlyD family secretion protein
MNKKKLLVLGSLVLSVLLVWVLTARGGGAESGYRFVEIDRGDVEAVVSSTGALEATTTVQVGTQVSGQIAEIYVDFNDRVGKGQLVARIDPTLPQLEVRAAEANLERTRAEMEQTERELERIQQLYDSGLAADIDHSNAQYQHAVAQAAYRSAAVNLEKARKNLNYTEIRAPIDGVVVERNVDVGQTVAASLAAPTLFLIAEDLSEMEILASVDESDIGLIQEGQEVHFTVQAYPGESFTGAVRQVRLQSTVQENVVNYTVVVAVENLDGRLLPGMTATLAFVIERASDVLRVPNAALRLIPTDEMVAALPERAEMQDRQQSEKVQADRAGRAGNGTARTAAGSARGGDAPSATGGQSVAGASGTRALLWFVDEDGNLDAARVVTGITDGRYTAIRGPGIEEGMQVIAAVTSSSAASASNPFQSQQGQGRRGPPPGM